MKKIEGAPEAITHAQVIAACEALGLDPDLTRGIKLGVDYVEVALYATTPVKLLKERETPPFLGGFTDVPAMHTVYYDTLQPTDDD